MRWVDREDRYAEKLATPDTSVADLIGDVDPIRVAEGRYLADELTIHYGLIPRTNRGIVAINELPDLPERIQVALFNILEERDVQIRGYRIRLPLDLLLVATANPDDYTHRGRIVSPLKDRFGTQVRTHYPQTLDDEIRIMEQEARPSAGVVPLRVPGLPEGGPRRAHRRAAPLAAREPPQRRERSLLDREPRDARRRRGAPRGAEPASPRPFRASAISPPCSSRASAGSSSTRSRRAGRRRSSPAPRRAPSSRSSAGACPGFDFQPILSRFAQGFAAETSDLTPAADLLAQFGELPGLSKLLERLGVRRRVRASPPRPSSSPSRVCTCPAG